MTAENVIFLAVVALAVGFFSYNVQRLVHYMRTIGHAEDRTDHPIVRLHNLLTIGLAQTKILRDPGAGILHAAVFWGFLVLTVGTVEVLIAGVVPGFDFGLLLPRPLYQLFQFSQELFGILVLGAVGLLLYRRLVVRPRRLQGDKIHSGDAIFVLSMIAGLMITLFLIGGLEGIRDPAAVGVFRPISLALTSLFEATGLSAAAAATGVKVSFWAHALLILYFLNHLPYSKHLHIVVSLPNVYLSNTSGPGQKGVMRYMDLEAEDAEQFGAS